MSTRNFIAFNSIIVTYVTWQGYKHHMMIVEKGMNAKKEITAEKERTNFQQIRLLQDKTINCQRWTDTQYSDESKSKKIEKN